MLVVKGYLLQVCVKGTIRIESARRLRRARVTGNRDTKNSAKAATTIMGGK